MVNESGPARAGRIATYNDPASTARSRRATCAESDAAAPVSTDTAVDRDSAGGSAIELRGLAHDYSTDSGVVRAIDTVDLDVAPGEFVSIIGPSGCGKTTMLRAVAGLLEPSFGSLSVLGGSPREAQRDHAIGLVTQEPGLMPWLTVAENVRMSLKLAGRPDAVDDWLRRVGLDRFAGLYPRELSGGMKQRVQIARMLTMRPNIMLMDEPFAALDAQTRQMLQNQLVSIWSEVKRTAIYVTHDIREAINLGQRIMLMTAGPEAGFKHEYQVQLDYPRDQTDQVYIDLLSTITKDIEEEVTKVWS